MNVEGRRYVDTIPLRNRVGRLAWGVAWALLFRPFAGRPFRYWRIFLLRCFGAKIGKRCSVYANVRVWAPWNLTLGDYVAVGPGAGAGGFVLYGRRDFGIRFGRAPDGHALAALQGHSGLKQQSGFEHRFCLPFYRNRGCAARRAAALWSFGTFKISRLPPSVKRAPGRFAPVWRRANMFIW